LEVAGEPQVVVETQSAAELQSAGAAHASSNPQSAGAAEQKPIAGVSLAFRALWAIIARFFKGLFGGGASPDKS
jgi:hypothetical protein